MLDVLIFISPAAGLGLSEEDWKSVNVLLNCGAPVKRNLEEIWPHLPNLDWLHSTAAGVEHILFPALVDGPVTLTNAKAGSSCNKGDI